MVTAFVWGALCWAVALLLVQLVAVLLISRAIQRSSDRTQSRELYVPSELKKSPTVAKTVQVHPIESTHWVNQILERVFIELREHQTVERAVVDKLNVEFASLLKKTKLVSRISVKSFTSGTRQPELRSVNIIASNENNYTDLILALNVSYSGMMALAIDTTLRLPALGLVSVAVKIVVREIAGTMHLRVFNPDESRAQVELQFTEPPMINIDVESTIGDRNRGIVEKAIKSLLKTFVAYAIVKPHKKSFMMRGEPLLIEPKKKSKDIIAHLYIKVLEAKGLSSNRAGFINPFVRARAQRTIKNTSVLHKNINPIWNEILWFEITEVDPEITIEVADRKTSSKSDTLGEIKFQMSTIPPKPEAETRPLYFSQPLLRRGSGSSVFQDTRALLNYEVYLIRAEPGSTLGSVDDDEETAIEEEFEDIVHIPGNPQRPISSPTCYVLGVQVIEGRSLHASDDNGFSDPYCKVSVADTTKKTQTIKKSLDPKWLYKMTFQVKNRQEDLVFAVYDWDLGRTDDFLGYASLPISSMQPNTMLNHTLVLQKRSDADEVKGEIIVQTVLENVFEKDAGKYDAFFCGDSYTHPDDRIIRLDNEPQDLLEDEDDEVPEDEDELATPIDTTAQKEVDDVAAETMSMDSKVSNLSSATASTTRSIISESGKKLHLVNNHKFHSVRVMNQSCSICGSKLGLLSHAYRCKDCLVYVHRRCHTNAEMCSGAVAGKGSLPSSPLAA